MAQNGSFPHPVIGNSDDVNSTLTLTNIVVAPSIEDVRLDFRLTTNDTQLMELVNDGTLQVIIFWHCRATLSSGILNPLQVKQRIDGWTYQCQLMQEDIRDRVDIAVEIVAPKDLDNFQWDNQHPDYGDQTFSVSTGDYLGIADSFYFDATKLYDAMNPPLGSIFKVVEDPKLTAPMKVDFSGETQVIIQLSSDVARGFTELGYYSSLKLSLVVLPALMETLSFISRMELNEDGEDLSQKEWYGHLKRLLAYHQAEVNQPLEAAQRLLGNPTVDALKTINAEEAED